LALDAVRWEESIPLPYEFYFKEQAFGEVLGLAENQTRSTNSTAAVATILERLRTVLGIAELSEVRSRLLASVRQEKP
jgi:hypothetical protein